MEPMSNRLKIAGATAALAGAWLATGTARAAVGDAAAPAPSPVSVPGLTGSAAAPAQSWNFHVQNTDIVQGYPGLASKYSGPDSLPNGGQTRETASLDLLAGARLWSGAEAHVDALMYQGFGVDNARGVDGFPNGEAFRLGTGVPNAAISRLFLRQTIGLGGDQEDVADDPLTLAGKPDVSRLTFTLGRFSAKDIFDNNAYANDPRTQFMNWALMANEAWDYPADALGYTTGLVGEWNQPQWTLRYGFFQMPRYPNSLTGEDRYLKWPFDGTAQDGPLLAAWGMVGEFERRYRLSDHPGTVRLLAFLNRANMADYSAATTLQLANGPGTDYSAARAFRYKYGFGLNWEQELARNVGVFARLGWNDDQEEGWVFSDVGYAGSLGLSIKGEAWHRADDTFALAGVMSGISKTEQKFLAAGGTGILAGDGNLNYGWEQIIETYYDFKVWRSIHTALDYQFIVNPAFNQDRGPVSVFGARVHWEF